MSGSNSFGNHFSWSNSRHRMFEECKRKYYYQYYGYWKGWLHEAPERVRTIYRLKQLDNRYLWKGTLVHEGVAFLLKGALTGSEPDLDRFKQAVVNRMRTQFKQSRRKKYRWDPKGKFGLLEHEYEERLEEGTWRAVRDDVLDCLDRFVESEVYETARNLTMEDCLALEGDLENPDNFWTTLPPEPRRFETLPTEPSVDRFEVGDVPVWVKLDFAFREPGGAVRIVDWKSGGSKDEPDPMQLNVYGTYAVETWGLPEEQLRLTVYNVARDERYDRTFSRDLKQETLGRLRASTEKMKSGLVDPESNQAREEDFPTIDDVSTCRRCRYRLVCKPELA